MARIILPLFLILSFMAPVIAQADGYPEDLRPKRRYRPKKVEEPPPPPPEPTCVSRSRSPKVRLVSWNPEQKVSKFLGEITECVTTMWEVLKILPGPNIINVEYPSEKEQWGYSWLWRYKLKNPIEDTLILMDNSGKRIMKGKNPVEFWIVFNEDDVVEKIEMTLVKKKNSQY